MSKDIPITDRDLELLQFIHRFRLATRDQLHRRFFPGATANAVAKVVARLKLADYLREHRVDSGFSYCTLGARGARRLGAPYDATRTFSEQTLPAAYAHASFCQDHSLHALTPSEFIQTFPALSQVSAPATGYFIYSIDGTTYLATSLVDRANALRHLFRKLDRLLTRHYKNSAFLALIQQRRFCVTILTGWPAKQDYLAAALRRKSYAPSRVEAYVVPQLQEFYRRI